MNTSINKYSRQTKFTGSNPFLTATRDTRLGLKQAKLNSHITKTMSDIEKDHTDGMDRQTEIQSSAILKARQYQIQNNNSSQ